MARYRKIDPRIWNDEKFQTLSDDGKLAFLFVLTHPHMTAIGAMRATLPGMAAELGWSPKQFRIAIMACVCEGMIEMNEKSCYVGLPNFLRYNEPEGPNSVIKAWPQALNLIPECPEKSILLTRCLAYLDSRTPAFRAAIGHVMRHAISDAKSEPCLIQEQEQEQEPEYPLAPSGETPEDSSLLTSEDIRQRWNCIPGVKPCKDMGRTIRHRVETRIKEHPQAEWWDNFFHLIQASDFLCGRINGSREPYHAALDWVLAPKNLDKLLAGNYDSIGAAAHSSSLTCTKRVQSSDGQFLRTCGQPATAGSKPTEPRCAAHFIPVQVKGASIC